MTRLASAVVLLFLVSLSSFAAGSRDLIGDVLRLPSEASRFFGRGDDGPDEQDDGTVGTRWAVLIAGSNGYWNYRHQVLILHDIIFLNSEIFFFVIKLQLLMEFEL